MRSIIALNGLGNLNLTKFSYLQRLKQRKQLSQFKEQIVFGLTLGWLMTLVGGFRYFFVINNHDSFWKRVTFVGIGLIMFFVKASAFAPFIYTFF